jgi:hypothetical protein
MIMMYYKLYNYAHICRHTTTDWKRQTKHHHHHHLLLLRSVGPAETRLTHCSLLKLKVLNPVLVLPFISGGVPRQTA